MTDQFIGNSLDSRATVDIRFPRGQMILVAIAAIVVGIVGLVSPRLAMGSIGLIFGAFLVIAGILRVSEAHPLAAGSSTNWPQVVLGSLVVVAGVLCLNNPFRTAAALTIVIGAGWIIDGIASIYGALAGTRERRWQVGIVGGVSIVAGILLIVLPHASLAAFVWMASLLSIAIGVNLLIFLIAFRPKDAA